MHEQLLETIERFAKREILPQIENLEKTDPETVSSILKMASDIGINLLPLPEEAGGIGLNFPEIGGVLRKISEVNAGIATIYLFHFGGMLPFLMDENGALIIKGIMDTEPQTIFTLTRSSTLMNITGVQYLSVYSEKDGKSIFSIIPLQEVKIIEKDKNLGLRPLSSSVASFEDIKINEKNSIIISLDEGRKLLNSATAIVDALLCAIAVGNSEGAYAHALKYAEERYQGGDIIVNHTIIQNMLGKIFVRIDASIAYCEKILDSLGRGNYEKGGIAKAFISENCEWACSDCVQIFGGYGYMKDFPVERHLRDAKSISAITGGNMFKLREYIRTLRGTTI